MATAIAAILLDVEGTTTPIDFVHGTLFPYARNHVADFLQRHWEELSVRADVLALKRQHQREKSASQGPPAWRDGSKDEQFVSVLAYFNWLMNGDFKCAPLKSLQGKIWEEGYQNKELFGQIYPDVPAAFSRWWPQKIIGIFSSGSVLAQRLLFSHSSFGDLSPFIHGYFDTTTGAKKEPISYKKIAISLGLKSSEVVFISDVIEELDAAREAAMETALCMRAAPNILPSHPHKVIHNFDDLFP